MNLLGTAIGFTKRTSIQRLVLLGAIVIKMYTKDTNVAIDVKIITYSYNLNDQIILNRLPYSIRYILIYDPSTYFQIKVLHSYSIYTILIYIVRE